MRHALVEAAVRTAVQRDQQQGTGLPRFYHREHTAHRGAQTIELIRLAQKQIGRKEQRVKLATDHVGLTTERGVATQDLTGQTGILIHYHARGMVTAQGPVQALRQTVVVQMGIDMLAPRVQLDQLILPSSHLEQGDPQTVEDTHHHVLMPTARLHHHLRLHVGKRAGGDTHTVAFQQAAAIWHVYGKLVGVRSRDPTQGIHLTIREVREIRPPAGGNPGEEIIQGKRTLQAEDLVLRGVDEHVVVQQGPFRVDHLAAHLPRLDIRGGEILEQGLPTTLTAGKLSVQPLRGADPVTPATGGREREHVPADGLLVTSLQNMRHEPIRALACQYFHLMIIFSSGYPVARKTDPTAIQSPTKNHLYHLDKQYFIFSNMALLKITIS